MIPSRASNLAAARKTYGGRVDFYLSFLTQGDPLADDVVLSFEKLPGGGGQAMLERALDVGIHRVPEAPAELRALFAQIDEVPDWVDWKVLKLGARSYQRTGLHGSLTLSALSLMNGYHSAPAAKALAFTGALDKMARRRLAETGRFITETVQVDGLRRFSPGFKTTIKVRMIHAYVRRFLAQSDRWDTAAWGTPINNADMAATTLSFSAAMLHGTRMMGFRFTTDEADALIQLWKYSGYLSGVNPGLLCSSESEAMTWSYLIDLLQPGPDADSVALAEALRTVNTTRGETPFEKAMMPWIARFHDGLTWASAGDEVATDLGTPNEMWKYAIPATRLLLAPIEGVRQRLPGATLLASVVGNRFWRYAVKKELQGKKAEFNPPARPKFEDRFPRVRNLITIAQSLAG